MAIYCIEIFYGLIAMKFYFETPKKIFSIY